MSEDTVSLAFQSDIVANVDVSAAISALDKLDKTIGNIEGRIKSAFDSLQSIIDKVSDVSTKTAGAQGKRWEGEREEIEKTTGAYQSLAIQMEDTVARWTESITMTRAAFQKRVRPMVEEAMSGQIRAFVKSGEEISEVRDKLSDSLEKWADREARFKKRSEGQTQAIVKAWMDLFDELVGHSVIPDLVNEMENQLVKRMEKILGEHAEMIRKFLLPKDASPEIVAKTYKIFIDEIEREQKRLASGFLKEADVFGAYAKQAQKSVEDLTEAEKKQVLEARVVGRELESMRNALRTYRDEIANMPKLTPLNQIAKDFARQGETIKAVTREVDDFSNNFIAKAAKLPGIISDKFVNALSGIGNAPQQLGDKIYTAIQSRLNRLPLAASQSLSAVAGEMGRIGDLIVKGADRMGDALLNPQKDIVKQIIDAWTPLMDHLAYVGTNAGLGFMENLRDSITLAGQEVVGVARTVATNVGDAMLDRFKYTMGGVFDVLTLKGKEERLRSRLQRAIQFEMPKSIEHLEEEINQIAPVTKSAADATRFQMRVMRQSFGEAASNIGVAVSDIVSGNIRLRDGLSGIGVSFVQLGRVMGRHVGHTESMNTVSRRFGETLNYVTRTLSGYQREGEIVDKNLNRLAKSTDDLSNHLKSGAEVLRKQQEAARQDMQIRQKAIAEYLLALDDVRNAEQNNVKLTDERGKKLVAALQGSIDQLQKFGLAEEVFGKLAEDLPKIRAEIDATGSKIDASLSEKLRTTQEIGEKMFGGMREELKKMSGNFPKAFSMMNRAVQDLEQNSKHFITTLRDGGKISTERLQDMLLALQDFDTQMKEVQKLGAIDPATQKYWEDYRRNMLLEIENFALMAQRSLVVDRAKEKLANTTKKVTGAIREMGQAAVRHIPIIGERAKVSSEQMEKFRSATSRVSNVSNQLSIYLGQLDPVFSDLSMGAGQMGQVFGAAMEGMHEAASVKGASIAKSLTVIKIAAVGIVGLFSGLIISTGKLAAEVTTLGITMRTVARNIGAPIPYLEELQKTLEDTGITSRESISAITAWMRARLPFEFEDAVSGMTYKMQDLAGAAQQMAVAMGEDSSEMFNRFIDFIQTGNSNLLDAAGIMKTANQMYEEYANAIGKVVQNLSPHEKQLALISGLMAESTTLTGVYTEAMKSAGKQLGSMRRYLEQLRLEWGKQFEPIVAMVIFRFNQLIQLLTDIPEKTKQTIAAFVAVATAISGIALALGVVLPKLNALLGITKLISKLIFTRFGIIITLVSLVAGALAKMFMGIKAEGEGIEGIVNRIDKLLESFGGLSKVLQPIMDWISNFSKMVRYHFELIGNRIGKFVENVRNKIKEFLEEHPEIESFLVRAKEVFGDLFSVIWRVVDQVLGAVEALLDQDWETFFEKLRTAGQYILAWMFEFFNEVVKSAFEWGYNIISSFVSGLIQYGRIAIPRAMTAIGNLIASFLEGHSPAKIGPLSRIDLWGGGLMNAFERGLRQKRILFDEDMFLGLSSLNAKAKLWGDNITDTFASGIAGRAATAVVPAMDAVGEMIARFLEGHSPPVAGRLAEIEDWGRNAFETFLSGFEMADYSILDQALSLVQSRMQTLVDSAQEAGPQIAKAMMQVRDAVAGAIFQARVTGGPLDLGGLRNIMVGTLEIYAADIAAVLEASFAAAEAQRAVQALQDQIAAAQQARQDAIQAAQDVLEGIQDQIKAKEKEVEALNEQMEDEIETRAKALGIFVDPKLMEALQRNLERANVEVDRAQRRLERVRAKAGKYGMNILSWEEINADTQLQLAKDRQAQVQDQIDVEEEKQRQTDELRAEIEERYKSQFDALEAEIESLQKRAEAQQEYIEGLRKADQAASRAEQEQLRAAQQHAKELAEHADLLNKALEERMKAEEEARKAIEGAAAEGGAAGFPTPKWERPWKPEEIAGPEIPYTPPNISAIFKEWFGKIGIELEGGLPEIIAGLKEKIEGAWNKFLESPFGKELKELGIIDFLQQMVTSVSGAIEALWGFISNIISAFAAVADASGGPADGATKLQKALWTVFAVITEIVKVVGKAIEFFADLGAGFFGIIEGIASGDWSKAKEGFMNAIGDISNLFANVMSWFGVTGEELVGWFDRTRKHIGDFFGWFPKQIGRVIDFFKDIPGEIKKALKKLWDIITSPFRKSSDEVVGKSIIPDMINSIIDWFFKLPGEILKALGNFVGKILQPFKDVFDALIGPGSIIGDIVEGVTKAFGELPGKILSFAGDFLKAAGTLGKNIYDGISGKVTEIKEGIGGWMKDVGGKIGDAATTFWDKATEVATQAYDAIKGKIGEAREGIGGWMKDVGGKISDAATTFWDKATEVATNVYNAIRDKIVGQDGIINSIVTWLNSVAGKMVEAAITFWNRAKEIAANVFNAIKDAIIGEEGIIGKIVGWLTDVAGKLTNTDLLQAFFDKAVLLGGMIKAGLVSALSLVGQTLKAIIVTAWNEFIRVGFNSVLSGFVSAFNTIIAILNAAAALIPIEIPGFPLKQIKPEETPVLPPIELAVGGIVMEDTIAKLHAGEVVLPLERLGSLLSGLNMNLTPAFSPTLNFYPGSSPQQIMPAIHQAYDWYTEEMRRG